LDDKITVRVSREWIHQAFEIVLDNAVNAMNKESGATKRITVTTQLANETVEIKFKDTGPGISEDRKHILLKEPVNKEQGEKGAGIGLLLAQSICQTYGGDISIESADHSGATVIISLPVEN